MEKIEAITKLTIRAGFATLLKPDLPVKIFGLKDNRTSEDDMRISGYFMLSPLERP